MTRLLNVYMNKNKVGVLKEKNGKTFSFSYDHNSKSFISLSMKSLDKEYDDKVVRPFLENLLPEGKIIDYIAKVHLVSKNNPFSLLSKIGEDCAGAISFTNNDVFVSQPLNYLPKDDFLSLLENNEKGLSYYKKGMRLSLAGAQDKISLLIKDGNYYLPSFDNPSTHIVKFNSPNFPSLLINEFFVTKLANKLKISVSLIDYINEPYPHLIIERYDRSNNLRIHQEDFCQILSVRPHNKYQKEGGPSFKNIVEIINKDLSNPALNIINLSRILIFNYLIGNCDYHSKNISVLYKDDLNLSPFYDLLSTYIYDDLSKDMAMSINKIYNIDLITKEDIIKEFDSWGIHGKNMFSLIMKEFNNIIPIAKSTVNDTKYHQTELLKIVDIIEKNYNKII